MVRSFLDRDRMWNKGSRTILLQNYLAGFPRIARIRRNSRETEIFRRLLEKCKTCWDETKMREGPPSVRGTRCHRAAATTTTTSLYRSAANPLSISPHTRRDATRRDAQKHKTCHLPSSHGPSTCTLYHHGRFLQVGKWSGKGGERLWYYYARTQISNAMAVIMMLVADTFREMVLLKYALSIHTYCPL